jgi:hypothetical protein
VKRSNKLHVVKPENFKMKRSRLSRKFFRKTMRRIAA